MNRVTEGHLLLAVAGAHLSGLPLHHELVERQARLQARTHTAERYLLHRLTDGTRPALERVDVGGRAIEVEVYALALEEVGAFLSRVAPPLAIGSVELASGEWVHGFVCEPIGLATATDITAFGGWRSYLDRHVHA